MTHLYRAYNAAGRLLYVGIAEDVQQRMKQHERDSAWIDDLAALDLEWFPTRTEARTAERAAIATEWPLWNIDGAIDGRMTQRICRQREWEKITQPIRMWSELSKREQEQHSRRWEERSSRVYRVTRAALYPRQVAWERARLAAPVSDRGVAAA